MADGYWNRQPPPQPSGGMLKRHRPDYELEPSGMPSAHPMPYYLPQADDHAGPRLVKDTKAIGSAYDRYLQSAQLPTSGEPSSNFGGVGLGRSGVSSGLPNLPTRPDPPVALGRQVMDDIDLAQNDRPMAMGFGGQPQIALDAMVRASRATVPLPSDASNTLYVEGLPNDCKKREVAHIFRPFVGYKEVRLVTKDSKHRGGDPLILCFVDFMNPACAATAMSALQGYKMDEDTSDPVYLRLQFSKHPGPRSGPGPRGKR